jgi:hypothetical protein
MVEVWICSSCNSTLYSRYKIFKAIQAREAEKTIGSIKYYDLHIRKKLHLDVCCAQEIISYQDMTAEIYGMDQAE